MVLIFLLLGPSIVGAIYLSKKMPQKKLILKKRDNFILTPDFENTFLG
jgi:hypothetical protein